jgi:ATP-dependent RNA helicase DDX41
MSTSPLSKRRHLEEQTDEPVYKLDDEDGNYVPYVPVKQRRQERLQQLASRGGGEGSGQEERPKKQDLEEKEDEELEEINRREKARKERTLLFEAQEVKAKRALEGQYLQPTDITCLTSTRCEQD